MIRYPKIENQMKIAVTAPSSGLIPEFYHYMEELQQQAEKKHWQIEIGQTAYQQDRVRSTDAKTRADELNHYLQSEDFNCLIPPWGGELLIEVLDNIAYDKIQPKWLMGYSDISCLLFAVTLMTGLATAHGINAVELRSPLLDSTSNCWEKVLQSRVGETIRQVSSEKFQRGWNFSNNFFTLTEPTRWKPIRGDYHYPLEGRLLGGCIDVLRHLAGTSYGDVRKFQKEQLNNEPILWYLENCELLPVDLKRSLEQLRLAGWFDNISGILFGRAAVDQAPESYFPEEVYHELAEELGVPVIFDIDCGHVPPQMTLVNGAWGQVFPEDNHWILEQTFRN